MQGNPIDMDNARYRAKQMMKGGGRPLMACKDPNDEYNMDYDEDGDLVRDEIIAEAYFGLMNADHLAGRMHRGDMAEFLRAGRRLAPSILRSLEIFQTMPDHVQTNPQEGAAAVVFLEQLIDMIEENPGPM